MAVVRCMRWACSDPQRLHGRSPLPEAWLAARSLWLPAAAALSLVATPAGATNWLQGVFPVTAFAGYSSPFGMRLHPLAGDLRPHYGVDIAAPLGSPVLSWWSGRIQEVIRDRGCGNGLVIRSGDYEHVYCHLAGSVAGGSYRSGAVWLLPGQRVGRGQLIGHVGLSGSSTGPHLHWGLRYRGSWLDPARVLRAMAASRRRFLAGGSP